MENFSMNVEPFVANDVDACSENLAAEFADAAYHVALRHGVGEKWLELQLDLWGALTHAIKKRSCLRTMHQA
jgi:hypothetical protein